MPPATQKKIGRYEVLDELGRGAMGVVYRARDTQIGRVVALKVILTAGASAKESEHYKQRFQLEARAAGRLSHPGIVTIHDIAEDETGQPFLVMEFVEGRPLDAYLESAPLTFAEQLDIGIQTARALDYAHRNGVVHRDIKPANILVTADGHVKIADFGIAKLAGTEMTQEGTSLGTPSYMSPEQFRGTPVDARSDQFSLGAVLFWMCTGQKPFAAETVTAISFQVVFEAPARPSALNGSLPPGLDAILSRCMAKSPEERYASCADLAADLEALKAGRPISARAAEALPAVERTAPMAGSPGAQRTQPVHTGAPEKTVAVPTGALHVEAAQHGTTGRLKVAVAVAALVALLLGGSYWWRRAEAGAPAAIASGANVAATPASALDASTPAVTGSKIDKQAIPAGSAMLRVTCRHNFRNATLEIFVDGERLLQAPLRGREHNYGLMKVYEGRLDIEHTVPAGTHSIRAWVISRHEGYDQQAAESGTFSEGGSRTLEIAFGKGSALGVVDRKMDLTLR